MALLERFGFIVKKWKQSVPELEVETVTFVKIFENGLEPFIFSELVNFRANNTAPKKPTDLYK